LTIYHHGRWFSRRLIGTLITVALVLFAVSRAIGKTVRRAQDDRFHSVLGLVARALVEVGARLVDAGRGGADTVGPSELQTVADVTEHSTHLLHHACGS
jgi:hypothetical protein